MKFLSLLLIFFSVNLYAQSTDCQEFATFAPDMEDGKSTVMMQTFTTSAFMKMEMTSYIDAAKNIKTSIKSLMGLSMETEMIFMDGVVYSKERGDTIWTYKNAPKQDVKPPVIPKFEQCKTVGSEVLDGRNFDIIEATINLKELKMPGFDSLQTLRIWVDKPRKKTKKTETEIKNDKMQIKVIVEYGTSVKIEKPKNAIPDSLKPKRPEPPKLTPMPFKDYNKDLTPPQDGDLPSFANYKYGPSALFTFLGDNLVYPKAAKDAKKEGTVYLGFMVEADGTISDIKVKRGIGYGCDEAAIEVMKKTSGNWQPVLSGGVPIRSPYTMPIKFKL